MPGFQRYYGNPYNLGAYRDWYRRSGVWSGVHRLIETPMLINGLAPDPAFVLVGGDAAAAGWQTRQYPASPVTLALQAGTAPSYNQGSPFLGAFDDSVKFNGGYFTTADKTFADVTTEDIVVEVLFRMTTATKVLFSKRVAVGNGGYFFYAGGATTILFQLLDAPGNLAGPASGSLTAGAMYMAHAFMDRSGSGQMYVNGAAAGAPVVISTVGSVTADIGFEAGSQQGGAAPWNSDLHYVALWKRAAWLDTHLQATVAAQRFALLTGSRPASSFD